MRSAPADRGRGATGRPRRQPAATPSNPATTLAWRPRRAWRRPVITVGNTLACPLGALVFLGMSSDQSDPVLGGLLLAVAVAFAAYTPWAAMVAVLTSPAGVIVRNWLRAYRVPWREVAAFDLDDEGISLVCKDGTPVWCSAFRRGLAQWPPGERFRPTLLQLQAELAQRRHH